MTWSQRLCGKQAEATRAGPAGRSWSLLRSFPWKCDVSSFQSSLKKTMSQMLVKDDHLKPSVPPSPHPRKHHSRLTTPDYPENLVEPQFGENEGKEVRNLSFHLNQTSSLWPSVGVRCRPLFSPPPNTIYKALMNITAFISCLIALIFKILNYLSHILILSLEEALRILYCGWKLTIISNDGQFIYSSKKKVLSFVHFLLERREWYYIQRNSHYLLVPNCLGRVEP